MEGAFAWCMKTTGETLISPAERVEAAPRADGGVAGAVADNEYPSNATPARWRDPALRRYLPAPCCRRRQSQTIIANPAASYTIARSGSGAPEMRVFDGTASDSYPRTLILRNCTAPGYLDPRLRYAARRSSYCSRASSGVL